MKKELIGFLICTLLLSVAIAPVINALDNEINEVNIVKEPKFGLTDNDAWTETIDDIITTFEDAQTQNEKIAILKEIPVVSDKYGLLPEDMTVEEAQELIISAYLETIASGSLQSEQSSVGVVSNIEDMTNNELISKPATIGKTIYVDDDNTDGPWGGTLEHPYRYIQDGIDAALIFWTVYVFNGTYYENVVVNKRINLIGEDKNTTIIDGGGEGDVVLIKNSGVQIKGFTIRNSGRDYNGIKVEASRVIIKNNIISNNGEGIDIWSKRGRYYHNIKITKNIITNNKYAGIHIRGGDGDDDLTFTYNTKITANYIANNRYGILMPFGAVRNIIMLNEIRDNKESGIEIGWSESPDFPSLIIRNIVKKNNFINNEKNAYFYFFNSIWRRNYWDDWDGKGFYKIKGEDGYPWFNIDWHPAREPYDIWGNDTPTEEVIVGKQEKQISQQNNQQSSKEPTLGLQDTDSWKESINDLITRFQDAETQDEMIDILKEIPVLSDKYGLLPEDMTVEEAQELIVSSYLETLSSDSFQSDKQSSVAGDSPLAVSKSVVPSALPQFQVSESNRINNIKLNPPQPAEWPPKDKCIVFGFGRISNPKYEFNGDEYYWSFNCENVICMLVDEYGGSYTRLFNNGEVRYLSTYVHVIGHFMFNFLNFYLVIE